MNRCMSKILALCAVLSLTACGTLDDGPPPPCPDIRIDRDTAFLVKFDNDEGGDITDIEFEAEIAGYTGECAWDADAGAFVFEIMPVFLLRQGAAAPGPIASFDYFLAIPAFFPAPAAKEVLSVSAQFPPGANELRWRDNEVVLRVPKARDVESADYTVWIGFQLTPEQLAYNRRRFGS